MEKHSDYLKKLKSNKQHSILLDEWEAMFIKEALALMEEKQLLTVEKKRAYYNENGKPAAYETILFYENEKLNDTRLLLSDFLAFLIDND